MSTPAKMAINYLNVCILAQEATSPNRTHIIQNPVDYLPSNTGCPIKNWLKQILSYSEPVWKESESPGPVTIVLPSYTLHEISVRLSVSCTLYSWLPILHCTSRTNSVQSIKLKSMASCSSDHKDTKMYSLPYMSDVSKQSYGTLGSLHFLGQNGTLIKIRW